MAAVPSTFCAACKGTTHLNLCSNCQSTQYCGTKCQREHWKIHKTQCKDLAAANVAYFRISWETCAEPAAALNLGMAYQYGRGVAADAEEAMRWYRLGATAGDPGAQCNLAVMHSAKGEVESAAFWHKKGAASGNLNSTFNLYEYYMEGRGVEKDEGTAVKYLQKAAAAGHVGAMEKLGAAYCFGTGGLALDTKLAIKWLRKADAAGSLVAAVPLAIALEALGDGSGAFAMHQKAAKGGTADGIYGLATCYMEGKGTRMDPRKAKELFAQAGKLGSGEALYRLGMFEEMSGSPKEAWRLFLAGAEAGSDEAAMYVGQAYYNGPGQGPAAALGVGRDWAEAVRWYKKAAELGNNRVYATLGDMYMRGEGVPRSVATAVEWLRNGADKGCIGTTKNTTTILF